MDIDQGIATGSTNLAISDPRSKILNAYSQTIENSFLQKRSQLKLINFGTGSGKTYQLFRAICSAIEKHPQVQIVGVYVAPLREHLQVPVDVQKQYPSIPIYKINSLEMKISDQNISHYKSWIPSILNSKELWNTKSKNFNLGRREDNRKILSHILNVIKRLEFIRGTNFGDEDYSRIQIQKAVNEVNNDIEKFLEILIRGTIDESKWPEECLKMIEMFFPLHLLRNKSGILLLTYQKFETLIPYFRHNGETWIRKNDYLDSYVAQHTADQKKFIFAFDEQEDGYEIMLDHKIDIISPQSLAINNALSSVSREFSSLFSDKSESNRELLKFVEKNDGAIREFREHLDKNKAIEQDLFKLVEAYRRLIDEEGNSEIFLQNLIAINKGIEGSFSDISAVFDDEQEPVVLNFDMLSRVFSKFENNRSLLISQKLYNKISHDLMNIFSYNNLYIYNIAPLKKLFLDRSSGGHVHITEQNVPDSTSVAELIYAVLAIRLQIKSIEKLLFHVLDAEDSQSRSLDIWSKQISKVQKASEEGLVQGNKQKYLNRNYVYESYKSIINIKEIARYQSPHQNLINHHLREVSIGSTAILTSPEQKLHSILEGKENVIFLISATGGIYGDLSTSYDYRYLEDRLRDESGESSFKTLVEEEIILCEAIRNHRREKRHITASTFKSGLSSFPNFETREIVERFEKSVLDDYINSITGEGAWFGIYKRQELQNFARFLFYLFEDDSVNETIAFTQTLRWIEGMIRHCEKIHHSNYIFEASSEHPNIYYFRINHKKYQSDIRVKIILYKASFNSLYNDNISQKSYQDELVEEQGQKIFFLSAYQSASKGLNPVIKNADDDQKDFDSLVLLMDSYYSKMSLHRKQKDSGRFETLYHFALMKNIVHLGDSSLEIKDFNAYLNRPEAQAFRQQQHEILLGKAILQAIGRSERREFPNQTIKIFINQETKRNLANFYRYLNSAEPQEIRKLSVNNFEVYAVIQEQEERQRIHNYDEHVYDEIDASIAFTGFRRKMLDEIEKFHRGKNTYDITKAWDLLRDPMVFKDPVKYLEKLRNSSLYPDDFVDSLFYYNLNQTEFIPHLALVEENGQRFQIISDGVNGDRIYSYQNRLYPEYLKTNARGFDLEGEEVSFVDTFTDQIYRQYKQLIPTPDPFDIYIPRPHFFFDVLYPSLAENFVERWIHNVIFSGKPWKSIKSMYNNFEQLLDFKKYSELYEKFDLYYIQQDKLFCIDVKAWSRASGNRLSTKTLEKTRNKIDKIASTYPQFSVVRGLLLNLHAPREVSHQFSQQVFSGNLIYFDNYQIPVKSSVLDDFLFSKEVQ